MKQQTPEQEVMAIHDLTLCVDIEIGIIQFITLLEMQYHMENGNIEKVNTLMQFQSHFNEKVANPFNKEIMEGIIELHANPDLFDYFLAYSENHLMEELMNAHTFIALQLNVGFAVNMVNEAINDKYPGIKHDVNIFPHAELIQHFHNYLV